uniref:Drought-responsive family protein n=1 Tax=Populus alba TaxID=43335 RepID=A0A4U5QDQ1_POPAL|nr:drought-responsive family protein [Populus alba]
MASDSWISRFSTSSRRYQTRSDLHEETEAEEDLKAEYLCPFCAEDFDVVGLFCHIDEDHPVEAKNGVCPVCAKRVGMDIVSHITGQHGNFFKISFYLKFDFVTFNVLVQIFCIIWFSPLSSLTGDYVQRKRRLRKGGANSAFSILRKELREGSLQSLLGGSSCFVSSSNSEPDPLLSPFIFNPPGFDEAPNAKPLSSVEASSVKGSTTEEFLERKVQPHLSDKDQEEKSRKSEFVRGLLLSTILDDEL